MQLPKYEITARAVVDMTVKVVDKILVKHLVLNEFEKLSAKIRPTMITEEEGLTYMWITKLMHGKHTKKLIWLCVSRTTASTTSSILQAQ